MQYNPKSKPFSWSPPNQRYESIEIDTVIADGDFAYAWSEALGTCTVFMYEVTGALAPAFAESMEVRILRLNRDAIGTYDGRTRKEGTLITMSNVRTSGSTPFIKHYPGKLIFKAGETAVIRVANDTGVSLPVTVKLALWYSGGKFRSLTTP